MCGCGSCYLCVCTVSKLSDSKSKYSVNDSACAVYVRWPVDESIYSHQENVSAYSAHLYSCLHASFIPGLFCLCLRVYSTLYFREWEQIKASDETCWRESFLLLLLWRGVYSSCVFTVKWVWLCTVGNASDNCRAPEQETEHQAAPQRQSTIGFFI